MMNDELKRKNAMPCAFSSLGSQFSIQHSAFSIQRSAFILHPFSEIS